MLRGGPRKPAVIRKLEGNRGHRPIPEEVQVSGSPEIPEHLTDVERQFWNYIVDTLPQRLLTSADVQVLERMSIAWATYRLATAQLRLTGPLVKGSMGSTIMNPLFRVRSIASQEMDRCGMQLGLSPVARTKLIDSNPDDGDPLSQLLALAANDED